ncbi:MULTISPECIES: peptidoglycan-binding protein [Brevibacterium]|uniref:Peptidoglycan-binding (PGRP) domain of peptidoglycan hydrolases-containing protein n=1 Tax=Brevibacterium antiquum CNRZ 918 TaxID=1255637 RepID=A0A2H1KZC4_9MICO|nr:MULTISPECIES: peptidoglycan-binding protein [Brevibacterium]SMY05116.1 Peptidoglycan-binding (PGRP) domain of peptidoglycan hydrolases-containing protein [Brevibacterium antiquum CNRZ 918]HCG55315.1 hypothetical protein [Brevibacterium sp.]
MSTSQNGYRANDRSLIASYAVPGGKLAMRKGDVATVLAYVAKRFHSEVEALKWPGNWGYAERPIRGSSTTLSNHASGTAIDLNAPQHPLGTSPNANFSSSQITKIHRILNDCDGVLRWGGDYRGRKDPMHVEINKGTAAVRSLAKKIRAGSKPGPSGGAEASGGGSSSPTYTSISGSTPLVKLYTKGEPVERAQKAVGVKADGYWGADSVAAAKKWQKANGLDADGMIGDKSWAVINGGKASKPKPSGSKAPAFPLPSGHYFGPKSGPANSHSGYYNHREHLRVWQKQMQKRGWTIKADGLWGSETSKVAGQFQKQKHLGYDKLVGPETWAAAWTEPIT